MPVFVYIFRIDDLGDPTVWNTDNSLHSTNNYVPKNPNNSHSMYI